jgi:RNA ligase
MSIHYAHPHIQNISDILPHIEGNDAFGVLQKDGGVSCIQYVVNTPDIFPTVTDVGTAMLRECRGIKFDTETGEILARTMQKFFNYGERSDLDFDLSQPHDILEKLDGSMVHPCFVSEKTAIRWMTKRGVTNTSMQVEEFVAANHSYYVLALNCLQNGLTPIFEWCSNKNPIVLNYPVDRLVLIAVRVNVTGDYMPLADMEELAKSAGVECVKSVYSSYSATNGKIDLSALQDVVRKADGAEGIVVRWSDGHMAKMKGDWYVLRHRAKEGVTRMRPLVALILEDSLDDILPLLGPEDREKVLAANASILSEIQSFTKDVCLTLEYARSVPWSRKDFAGKSNMCKSIRSSVFAHWDVVSNMEEIIRDSTIRTILHHCGSNSMFRKNSDIIPTAVNLFLKGESFHAE